MGVCLCGIETAFIEFKCTRARIDYLVCTAQAENAESALLLLHLPHDFFLRYHTLFRKICSTLI